MERIHVSERFYTHQLPNGLALLAQPLEHVVSTAARLALPAGASRDGQSSAGACTVLAEWLFRGAGGRDSRTFNDALEATGCHHGEDVASTFLHLSFSQTHQNLLPIMGLYADVARRANLGSETFAPCLDLAIQELAGLEDQPTRRCNLRLREQFYPAPLGASPLGTAEALADMTAQALRDHAGGHVTPCGAILAVAGHLEWEPLREAVTELFGDWEGPAAPEPSTRPAAGGITHEAKQTAQVQIGLAYPAPMVSQAGYYPMRVAEMVLSGGMSGRLFTEVREKRGLVYSVGARYHGLTTVAGIFVYAGTTPEKADETLEVTVGELRRLGEGITEAELARAKTQLKAALVMQGESTAARAAALVSDWHLLGRLRGLEEIAADVDAVTVAAVTDCLAAYPPAEMTACFIGPEPLETGCLQG